MNPVKETFWLTKNEYYVMRLAEATSLKFLAEAHIKRNRFMQKHKFRDFVRRLFDKFGDALGYDDMNSSELGREFDSIVAYLWSNDFLSRKSSENLLASAKGRALAIKMNLPLKLAEFVKEELDAYRKYCESKRRR